MRLLPACLAITIAACAPPPQTITTYVARDRDSKGALASGCKSYLKHGSVTIMYDCTSPQGDIELEYVDVYEVTVGFR